MKTARLAVAALATFVCLAPVAADAATSGVTPRFACTTTTPPSGSSCTYTPLVNVATLTVTATTLPASADVYCDGVWVAFAIANAGQTTTKPFNQSGSSCKLVLGSNGTATATAN